jgi:hypothetical protein
MSEQVMIGRSFLRDLKFLLGRPRTKIDAKYAILLGIERALSEPSQPVSAQPSGEVPKTVAWKRTDYSDCITDNASKVDNWRHCSDINGPIIELIDKAQHTRIVAELKARAVVMPERRREAETDEEFLAWVRGWNACLDEVARLNGKQVDQLEWSRKHGIEEY